MWRPRLASFAMLVGSLAGLYLLYQWAKQIAGFAGSEMIGPVATLALCVIIGLFGVMGGIGGIVASFAIEPDGEGHFKPRNNWLGKLVLPDLGFCGLSMTTGWFVTLIGVLVVVIGLFLFEIGMRVFENLVFSAQIAGVFAAVVTFIFLVTRQGTIGKIIRGLFYFVLSCLIAYEVFFGSQVPDWSEVGTGMQNTVSVMWPIMWPILVLIGGIVGAFVLRKCVKDTRVYQAMCPKQR